MIKKGIGDKVTGPPLIFISFFLLILFNFPFISIFNFYYLINQIPVLYLSIFSFWFLMILFFYQLFEDESPKE